MTNVLLIEDNQSTSQMIKEKLTKEGFQVTQAFSGTEAKLRLEHETFQILLLDLMLPGMTGEELIRFLQQRAHPPIIVISAKDEISAKIDVLSLGADDYLVKPFDLNELVARMHVQLRKTKVSQEQPKNYEHKGILLNEESGMMTYHQQPLKLTRREFYILALFLKNPQKIFSKQNLYESVWQEPYLGDEATINVHMSNLRKKLAEYTSEEIIETVWGVGFRLVP